MNADDWHDDIVPNWQSIIRIIKLINTTERSATQIEKKGIFVKWFKCSILNSCVALFNYIAQRTWVITFCVVASLHVALALPPPPPPHTHTHTPCSFLSASVCLSVCLSLVYWSPFTVKCVLMSLFRPSLPPPPPLLVSVCLPLSLCAPPPPPFYNIL